MERQKSNTNSETARDNEPKNRISNRAAGNLCIFYLLVMLAFLAWQLFDTWIGRYSLLRSVGYSLQREQTLRLIAFTLIAGALGGVVNGLRSTIHYRERFERRHTWKYLCAPWMGATLALFVYALLRSSIGALGGAPGSIGTAQVVANFSVGALGYGSKDVFIWLDAKVAKLFDVASDESKKAGKTNSSSAKKPRRKRKANQASRPKALVHRAESGAVSISTMSKAS